MTTTEKIALLIRLLEEKYPCEEYDKADRTSSFRLRADKLINKLYQLEENGGKNRE